MAAPSAVRTTCPYCGVGCGVIAETAADGTVSVRGDPEHPANYGRLCSKGSALAETLTLEDRLLHPMVDGRRAGWDEALDLVAGRFAETIAEHGPDSVAFYVSGQLLTEDYYVANKLMKGFIGSANIDTNSRLCMASAVAGHKRAFGADTVPVAYEDLEEADLVVLVGSNTAWCHPVLFQRLLAAKEKRGTIIVAIDPRRTATAESADLHLAITPGSDVALFNGLFAHLWRSGAADLGFVAGATTGIDAALRIAEQCDLDETSAATGIDAATLRRFYDLFAAKPRTVTAFSQGVNQSVVGTDKVNAIINCHLLTGRIGKPGAGPFSITGQPNAMGGREVGGLANQLAAHMDIDDAGHRRLVRRFWHAPRMASRPGLKAVDLFRAVESGAVKALWVMATNPADSMPDAGRVEAALASCPFLVVSDVSARTDTARHADVLLPAAAWGEKDGTVTNSERRISRQRAFRPPPGDARPDWWIVAEVARRMGHAEAFGYASPAEIFAEHAALSAYRNDGARDFDLGGLAAMDQEAYDALAPVRWPARAGRPPDHAPVFADGRFFTPDGRARFVATPPPAPVPRRTDYPFLLNTGRIRDQWHTMTNTGRLPRLSAHLGEPFVAINPADAATLGIAAGTLAEVWNTRGRLVLRATLDPGQPRGTLFVPMHWTDQYASAARVDTLVEGAVDPVSGQPDLKRTPVGLAPFRPAFHGYAVLRERPRTLPVEYWALARVENGWRLEFAGATCPASWPDFVRSLISAQVETDLLAVHDSATTRHRFAVFDGGTLIGAVFVAPEPIVIARGFVAEGLASRYGTPAERLRLLAGRPTADRPDPGPIVCSCFSVGLNQITEAVAGRRCLSVEAVGELLRAGTNCGSCRPEIRRLIDERSIQAVV